MPYTAATRTILTMALILAIAVMLAVSTACTADSAEETSNAEDVDDMAFAGQDLATDTSISSIDIDAIMGGGPSKDGIPALTNPEFVTADDAQVPSDDVQGILLDIDGDMRYYPYNILVWHEVVNDEVGGKPVTVTF
jgi:hypothetical protein